jgi:hypothetical protein
MTSMHPWPGLRWLALAWLALYLPVYWQAYGAWHFLMLCNFGLLLSCVALVSGSRLLVSSQAIATPVIALAWIADVATKLATGHFLHGGTAYMWDAGIPLAARALSLYHLGLPLLLAYCLRRSGYDRRGFALQCAIAAAVLAVSLWLAPPAEDLNYLHGPAFARFAGEASTRAALEFLVLVLAFYLPAHLGWRALAAAGVLPARAATVAHA